MRCWHAARGSDRHASSECAGAVRRGESPQNSVSPLRPTRLGNLPVEPPLPSHARARAREVAAAGSYAMGTASDLLPRRERPRSQAPSRIGGVIPWTPSPYDEDKGTYTVLHVISEESQEVKIHCPTDLLADRLATAARATSTRASIQVAAGIRITAGSPEEPVELAATDLELSLRVPLDAEVEEPGVRRDPGAARAGGRPRPPRRPGHARPPTGPTAASASRPAPASTSCTRTRSRTSRGCPRSTRSASSTSTATRSSPRWSASSAPRRATSRVRC